MIENNSHIPVLLEGIKKFIPKEKKINVIDATFGGGSYSRMFLETFKINKLIAIDRDPITKFFSKDLSIKFKNFKFINGRFSEIDKLVTSNFNNKDVKFDIIIFDLGISSNQLNNPVRGFSFNNDKR